MTIDWDVTARILEAIAWPLIVAVTLVRFQKPLGQFLDRVASRATKVSLGDYSVELQELREAIPTWQSMDLDVRKMTSFQVFDSATQSLFDQLTQQNDADFVVIDLGAGDQWLSSRLYIFAVVLGRVRGVKALAFVADRGGVTRRFIGAAEPEAVREALARRYPWLEAAFMAANLPYDPRLGSDPFALLSESPLESWRVQNVVRSYIENIQQTIAPVHDEEWQSLGDAPAQVWERTRWIDADAAEQVVGDALDKCCVSAGAERTKNETVAAIMRSRGKFVATVDDDRRFRDLLDRSTVVDRFLAEAVV
jgi:hypothetical protein